MGLEPPPRPMAERLVAMLPGRGQCLHEPAGSRRDQVAQRLEAAGHGIGSVNRPAEVVHQRRREQFLVEGLLLMDKVEDLERMLEHVALGAARRMLPHRRQHGHRRGDRVEPVAHEMPQ